MINPPDSDRAKRIQALRQRLDLAQEDFGQLLGVTGDLVGAWERGLSEKTECWDKLIYFMEQDPVGVASFLSKRDVPELAWPERWLAVQRKTGLTTGDLAVIMETHELQVKRWRQGVSEPLGCHGTLFWILEQFADADRTQWPAILETPRPTISPERIKILRLSLAMKQRELAYLLHLASPSVVSMWETGVHPPGWCADLLLKLIEAFPREAIDLLERIPLSGEVISGAEAMSIREDVGLTQNDLAKLLNAALHTIVNHERAGAFSGCDVLVYVLLRSYPDEFLSLVQAVQPRERIER